MKTFVSIIVFFLCAATGFAQTPTGCNPYPKTITVTGSAEMEITPDQIYVQVTLQEYQKKGKDKIGLEQIKADFLAKCKAAGIEDSNITIASYDGNSYSPWYLKKNKPDPTLFSSISYQVVFSNVKKMDALVNVLDVDATSDFQITSVSSSKITGYRKQLKIEAIKAAKDKAIYLSDAIGEKIGDAITIVEPEEQTVYTPRPMMSNMLLKANNQGSYDNSSTVDFKKMKLQFTVTIVFALK